MKNLRPITLDGDVAYVPLTKGHVALIDATDVCLVEHLSWAFWPSGSGRPYAARSHRVNGHRTIFRLHHALLPPREGFVVDHRNGDGLDNRRSNLRYVTKSTNNRNVARGENFGLRFDKTEGDWVASVRLGRFKDKSNARAAVDAAHRCLFPEMYEDGSAFRVTASD